MTDTRLLQLQARLYEGEPLTGLELLELEQARRKDDSLARLLRDDMQLHEELKALHRIDATQEEFVRRCLLATGAGLSADKVEEESNANAVASPALITAPRLELGDRADRLRRNRKAGKTSSTRQVIGWLSAAAAITLVALGSWWWVSRSADLSNSVAKTEDKGIDPAKSESRAETRKTENGVVEIPVEGTVGPKFETKSSKSPSPTGLAESAIDPEASSPDEPDEVVPDLTRLASLQFSPESVWGQKPHETEAYPAIYALHSGIAELVMTDGTRLVFQGPASFTLESPRQMRLNEGQIQIEPVAAENSFSVETPTVWLDSGDNLLAYLNVRPAEGTMVQIEKGALSARPWMKDGESEMLLSENELDRGMFGPAWREDSTQPATAIAVNDNGKFQGIVHAADRPLSITSPAVFARILDESRSMIRDDGQRFPEQWRGMVDRLDEAVSNMELKFDNQSVKPGSAGEMLDQFERIRQQMMSDTKGSGGNGVEGNNQSSGFSGVLNVNGREQRFSSPEEFQAAQNKMFGPMAGQMMFGTSSDLPGNLPPALQNLLPGNLLQGGNTPENGNSNSSSAFSGMINNNGQSMQFTSPEEFNRAMQQFKRR